MDTTCMGLHYKNQHMLNYDSLELKTKTRPWKVIADTDHLTKFK